MYAAFFFQAGKKPRHAIFDQGPQFFCDAFKAWCQRLKIKPRFGAVGQHGSIAIVERFIRSFKTECVGSLPLVPMHIEQMLAELEFYAAWFNEERPHQALGGRTPNEVYFRRKPANTKPRLEPGSPLRKSRGRDAWDCGRRRGERRKLCSKDTATTNDEA